MTEFKDTSYSIQKLPDYVEMGKYSSVADNVKFHAPSDNHRCVVNKNCVYTTNWDQPASDEKTVIGNDVWIGDGARIMSGVHIGDGAIIGAGAVVAKDVPAYAVIIGNPQQITRFRFNDELMKELLTIKWWDLSEDMVEKLKPHMQDVNVFLLKYYEYNN